MAVLDNPVPAVVQETELPGIPLAARGKVRDIYDLGDRLLIIATDRISAFDCILPTGIPDKGRVLTAMSRFWFGRMADLIPHHLEDPDDQDLPASIRDQWPALRDRSMVCKKASPFPVECVARGYLAGSAWKEYRENVRVGRLIDGQVPCAGIFLPPGLVESDRLPSPVFTPTTKAEHAHDEPIPFEEVIRLVGENNAVLLRETTLQLYERAARYAESRGIIIADTKFEFGSSESGIMLIDEVLTPDSSRFWDVETYHPGRSQPSYDKQFVRDYLETLDWNKTPPAPPLPPEIVERTADKYREAYRRITEKSAR